jgi:hypothetical protein
MNETHFPSTNYHYFQNIKRNFSPQSDLSEKLSDAPIIFYRERSESFESSASNDDIDNLSENLLHDEKLQNDPTVLHQFNHSDSSQQEKINDKGIDSTILENRNLSLSSAQEEILEEHRVLQKGSTPKKRYPFKNFHKDFSEKVFCNLKVCPKGLFKNKKGNLDRWLRYYFKDVASSYQHLPLYSTKNEIIEEKKLIFNIRRKSCLFELVKQLNLEYLQGICIPYKRRVFIEIYDNLNANFIEDYVKTSKKFKNKELVTSNFLSQINKLKAKIDKLLDFPVSNLRIE